MKHVGDIMDSRPLGPQSTFQVHHRHLLLLLDDAERELPERQWHSLRDILARRVGATLVEEGETAG